MKKGKREGVGCVEEGGKRKAPRKLLKKKERCNGGELKR